MDQSIIIENIENIQEEGLISHECSMDDLGDTVKINIPKNIKSPKNLKSIRSREGRINTEEDNKENDKYFK